MWGKYGKAIAQVIMAVLVVGAAVTTGDGHISDEEKFQLAVAFASAISTYLVPAVPEWPWMKTAVAAIMAGVTTAGSVALDGVSTNDVIVIVIAIFGVGLTAIAPANTEQRHRSTQHPTLALILVGALAGSALALTPADSAKADPTGGVGIQSCRYMSSTGTGPAYGGGFSGLNEEAYDYGPQLVVPSWSSCSDIQSPYRNGSGTWPTPLNTWFRVRFFPSSGGSYVNSWKSNNIGVSQNLIIATSVGNGTRYRVETQQRYNTGTIVQQNHNFDLMD